jgi:hypothetical protein
MTDTPQHIRDIHLKLWLKKPLEERLYQIIKDIEEMRHVLQEIKRKMGLPQLDLDPVGEYLKKKEEKTT